MFVCMLKHIYCVLQFSAAIRECSAMTDDVKDDNILMVYFQQDVVLSL